MRRFHLDPKISVSIIFVVAMFVSIMDGTIVNVALPALSQQFHMKGTSIDIVVVAYLVTLAVIIPVSGWMGDRWGTKRVFLSVLALFALASALCGLAWNFEALVAFRALQGLAGGALIPVGTAILYRIFPPEERIRLSSTLMIPTIIAPATGPVLGGFFVDHLSWRWVFYVNVPICIAACLFGLVYLQEHREPDAGSFDLPGFLLAGIGLALTMYALSEGASFGWTSFGILGSLIVGVILLVLFVVIELRTKEPMIDLRLLGNHIFRTCNLVSLFAAAGFLGVLFVAPLYLQEGRGISAFVSGLTTFPESIGVVVSTQFVSRLYPRIGPRRLTVAGLIWATLMLLLLCFMGNDTNLWLMRILLFMTGFGMAYMFLPMQTAAFATITHAEMGRATALFNVQWQVGAAFGIAVMSTVLSIVGLTHPDAAGTAVANLTAYHVAFIAGAALVAIGLGIAFKVRDKDAAATMQGERATLEVF
ncbi:MAG TPA: MDR family MFS transporter [Ktedonobacteraceae bacterium]|jgi:EmrB/QacA subfamily drug resistance transporter|nr:MDR family MFS transporter [Ktedonobacteraceae bacterium]